MLSKEMKIFILFVRMLYNCIEIDETATIEKEDIEYLIKIAKIHNLFDVEDVSDELRKATAEEMENIFNWIFETVETNLYKLSVTSLKGYETNTIKNLYLLFMNVERAKESEDMDELQQLSDKVYLMLDNYNQRVFYEMLESNNLLKPLEITDKEYFKKVKEIYTIMSNEISTELIKCGVIF